MNEARDRAEAKLLELAPPDASCDRATYTKYVLSWLAGKTVSLAEIANLCRYFDCSCEELAEKIVNDQFGKG